MKFMHSALAGYFSITYTRCHGAYSSSLLGINLTTVLDDRLTDSFQISEEYPGCKSNRQNKSAIATAHLSCIEINASRDIVKKKLKKLCGFSHQPLQEDIIYPTLRPESHHTNPIMSV